MKRLLAILLVCLLVLCGCKAVPQEETTGALDDSDSPKQGGTTIVPDEKGDAEEETDEVADSDQADKEEEEAPTADKNDYTFYEDLKGFNGITDSGLNYVYPEAAEHLNEGELFGVVTRYMQETYGEAVERYQVSLIEKSEEPIKFKNGSAPRDYYKVVYTHQLGDDRFISANYFDVYVTAYGGIFYCEQTKRIEFANEEYLNSLFHEVIPELLSKVSALLPETEFQENSWKAYAKNDGNRFLVTAYWTERGLQEDLYYRIDLDLEENTWIGEPEYLDSFDWSGFHDYYPPGI